MSNGIYQFTVDWGDGVTDTISSVTDANKTHTYTTAGDHTVTIAGDLLGWSFLGNTSPSLSSGYSNPNAQQLKEIKSWGSLAFGYTFGQFAGATNLVITATDAPDLTYTTSLRYCFLQASGFNSSVNSWSTDSITNMSRMFSDATSFNQALNQWNTDKVTDMSGMFTNATAFNQALDQWNTGKVTDMKEMFVDATTFNGDISDWNTGKVTNMSAMFTLASAFNADISKWDTGEVTNMSSMFFRATAFSQDLSGWDVDEVTNSALFSLLSGLSSNQLPNFP